MTAAAFSRAAAPFRHPLRAPGVAASRRAASVVSKAQASSDTTASVETGHARNGSNGFTPVTSVLGTMTFGWRYASRECGEDVSRGLMEMFLDAGHVDIDTALAYSGGETERMMGRIFEAHPELLARPRLSIATKANPWPGGNMTSSAGEGGLAPGELRKQVEASCDSLAPGKIDLLYLHAPDGATLIEDTLGELKSLHDEGKFTSLGLSNFPAWEVMYIHQRCKEIGLVPPTVYQGMYNCVTRACEAELVPALRKLNMRFLCYNPLAGGLLSGKHRMETGGASAEGRGRFTDNAMYQDRFWKPEYFEAVDKIRDACEEAGEELTPAAAALRWLYSHSQLDGSKGDGVILGASSTEHLEANLEAAAAAARGERLPEGVLQAIEEAFEVCRPAAPPYSRGHSKIA